MSAPTAAAAPAPSAAPASSIRRIIPGFAALSEQGHWDACAIIAEMAAAHACPWAVRMWPDVALSNPAAVNAKIVNWRQMYLSASRWTVGHGTTLGNIYWHLGELHAHLAGYIPTVNSPNLTALHDFVKRHTYHGNPVIIFISRAYNLTKNEAGVYGHFVTLGGIDSTLGYVTANGDTLDGLRSAAGAIIPCQWNTWAQLVAAGINGAIALDASYAPPAPPSPPAPPVTPPPSDSSPDLHALAADALSALQKLTAALP